MHSFLKQLIYEHIYSYMDMQTNIIIKTLFRLSHAKMEMRWVSPKDGKVNNIYNMHVQ